VKVEEQLEREFRTPTRLADNRFLINWGSGALKFCPASIKFYISIAISLLIFMYATFPGGKLSLGIMV